MSRIQHPKVSELDSELGFGPVVGSSIWGCNRSVIYHRSTEGKVERVRNVVYKPEGVGGKALVNSWSVGKGVFVAAGQVGT